MKRVKRNLSKVLDDLKKEGLTNKEIYTKLKIPRSTFYSYKRYFDASKINKNSRKPPEEVIKKVKKLASNRGIRLTQDIGKSLDVLVYIKTFYTIKVNDETVLNRNIVMPISLEVWRETRNKEAMLKKYIKDRYKSNKSEFAEVSIKYFTQVLENEL